MYKKNDINFELKFSKKNAYTFNFCTSFLELTDPQILIQIK